MWCNCVSCVNEETSFVVTVTMQQQAKPNGILVTMKKMEANMKHTAKVNNATGKDHRFERLWTNQNTRVLYNLYNSNIGFVINKMIFRCLFDSSV